MRLRSAVSGLLAAICLTACVDPNATQVSRRESTVALPPMLSFSSAPASVSTRSNAAIFQDFMDLTFEFESGRQIKTFSRIEGPITLRVTGKPPGPVFEADLTRLLDRLRDEAGIPIRRVPSTQEANLTIDVRSTAEIQSAALNAACFVEPDVSSFAELRSRRGGSAWDTLTTRDRLTVFLPNDRSPQLVLECLHEELAQALGPVNDLWRLEDSVFNDDNVRSVLTGFDMLILRATYDPQLRTGHTRADVAARLPGILERINPAGRGGGRTSIEQTSEAWKAAINEALNPSLIVPRRLTAAGRAVKIARTQRWMDNRLAFALLEYGRLTRFSDPDRALRAWQEARQIYSERSTADLHAAFVGAEIAAFHLRAGSPGSTLAIIDPHIVAAKEGQNAELLATLLLLKADALDAIGKRSDATIVRREGLGWAQYGLGNSRAIRQNLARIAALSPDITTGETQ